MKTLTLTIPDDASAARLAVLLASFAKSEGCALKSDGRGWRMERKYIPIPNGPRAELIRLHPLAA